MTAFYKIVLDGYIEAIGTNGSDDVIEITEAEYAEILAVIRDKPAATDTTDYRLREDLTWEAVESEPDPEEELTAEEIAAAIEEALA